MHGLPEIVGAVQSWPGGARNGQRWHFVQFIMSGGGRSNYTERISAECDTVDKHLSKFQIDSIHFTACDGWKISVCRSKARGVSFEDTFLFTPHWLILTVIWLQGDIGVGISAAGIIGHKYVRVLPARWHSGTGRGAQSGTSSNPHCHHGRVPISNERQWHRSPANRVEII